jgi:hypothetical protein
MDRIRLQTKPTATSTPPGTENTFALGSDSVANQGVLAHSLISLPHC